MLTSSSRVCRAVTVAVGGARRRPHGIEIAAEGEHSGAFVGAERLGAGGFAAGQLGFSGGESGQRALPAVFQAAGYEPVVQVDGTVAAFGHAGGVAGAFNLASPLVEGG
jgi:hypothetical protein